MRLVATSTLVALSAALQLLAVPPIGWAPLAAIAPVPLYMAISQRRPAVAAFVSWSAGFIVAFVGFIWFAPTLARFSALHVGIAWLLAVVLAAYHAMRWALFGWLVVRTSQKGWPFAFSVVAAQVAAELIVPWPFPWHVGSALHDVPILLQVAELGGPLAVSTLVMLASVLCVQVLPARLRRGVLEGNTANRRWCEVIAVGAALAAAVLFGTLRSRALDSALAGSPKWIIGVVQPNFAAEASGDIRARVARLVSMTASLTHVPASSATPRGKPDLVVWSESAVSGSPEQQRAPEAFRALFARRVGVPLLFGAGVIQPAGEVDSSAERHASIAYNSAFVSDGTGTICSDCRYDKQLLIPFGEYIPGERLLPTLRSVLPNTGQYVAGPRDRALLLNEHPLAVLICYEDLHANFVQRQVAKSRAELLVNLSNDGWFVTRDAAEWHLALAQLRAVEHRRYLVRATNSGISAVIDPLGRVVARAPHAEAATLRANVAWLQSRTLYGCVGDAPWWLITATAFAMAIFPKKRPFLEACSRTRSP